MANPSRRDQPQPIINFAGPQVALGPARRDLIPLYQSWVNSFETARTLELTPQPMTLDQEVRWFESITSNPANHLFTIYTADAFTPVGLVEVHKIDHRHQTAEIGVMVGESAYRGRGIGTEAVMLITDYCFSALGLHNVMLIAYAFNHSGLRAYQKAGFHEFGRRREARLHLGQRWDVVYMDVVASEFTSPVLRELLAPDEWQDIDHEQSGERP